MYVPLTIFYDLCVAMIQRPDVHKGWCYIAGRVEIWIRPLKKIMSGKWYEDSHKKMKTHSRTWRLLLVRCSGGKGVLSTLCCKLSRKVADIWVCPEKGIMGEYWERDSQKTSHHHRYSLFLVKSRCVLIISRHTHILQDVPFMCGWDTTLVVLVVGT